MVALHLSDLPAFSPHLANDEAHALYHGYACSESTSASLRPKPCNGRGDRKRERSFSGLSIGRSRIARSGQDSIGRVAADREAGADYAGHTEGGGRGNDDPTDIEPLQELHPTFRQSFPKKTQGFFRWCPYLKIRQVW